MKLLMILPKYQVDISDPCCFPLGPMYISSVLKQAGHDVTVLNYNLWDYDPAKVDIKQYDRVLLTGFEEFLPIIQMIGKYCKSVGVKTILGGALATFRPKEMLEYIDTVVIGEGEAVILQALHSQGEIRGTKPNLDELPFPDYEGFGIDEYHKRHKTRYMGVLTSRGCPFDCKFCAQTCFYQSRSLEHVFEEIDHYKSKYGVQMIVFNDNTLNISKKRFLAICEGMEKRNLKWSAAIRCDNFDEVMAFAAKESGCVYFVVGVESFNQDRLDAMNKRIKAEQVRNTLDLLHRYEIDYHGNILYGLPGETAESVIRELDSTPKWYKVFPVFVQSFVGTTLGGNDKLTKPEKERFSGMFKEVVQSGGKYMYPELAA